MMATVSIRIESVTTRDLWCDTCSTSGGVRVDVYQLKDDGVNLLGFRYACITCRSLADDEQ